MVSASWQRRKSSNRSACEPRAPRWTSEINKVRKRRSGHPSLITSLPMREQLAESHDRAMTIHAAAGTSRSKLTSRSAVFIRRPSVQHESDVHFVDSQIAVHCDSQATDAFAASRPGEGRDPSVSAIALIAAPCRYNWKTALLKSKPSGVMGPGLRRDDS